MNKISIAFFSNYLIHHQTPFCDAMVSIIGDDFHFIATEKIPQERLNMGYSDLSYSASYTINSYENYEEAAKLAKECDVVILGDAPDIFIRERLKAGKLTFRYSERLFKKGRWRIISPRVLASHWLHDFLYRDKNLHMLCASAYTAPDCRFIFSYPNKTYKWGYFPETKHYKLDSLFLKKNITTILWCGRLIKIKHPDDAVRVAQRLKSEGYHFKLNIIGSGSMECFLHQMIYENQLENYVHLVGSISPNQVRTWMEQAGIFLLTSDRNEGWGAVINEAMNSGCAVVASHAIGSVPFLINNNNNGMIYKYGDFDGLYHNIKYLLDFPKEQRRLGESAYHTITEEWNATKAAERFVDLARHILDGEKNPDLYESGPCSKAEIIKDNWIY